METKEQLQAKIEALQTQLNNLTHEIQREQKKLEDINKPVINESVYDIIVDTVRDAVTSANFSEDDFEVELSMDYDNTVTVDRLTFNEYDSLADDIIRHIDKQFRVSEMRENVDGSLSSIDEILPTNE
tara:strand:- start:527 stop:910 length:384 start_codon:yes stop_codon:yes gene_type:complete